MTPATCRDKGEEPQHMARLAILYSVLQAATASLDPEEVCAQIATTLSEVGSYPLVGICLKVDGQFKQVSAVGWDEDAQADVSTGVYGRVMRHGQPEFIKDVSQDPDYVTVSDNVTCEICVPMRIDGQVMGLLNVESTAEHPLTDDDFQLIQAVAEQISLTIRNALLYKDLQEARENQQRMLRSLLDVTPDIIIFKDVNHVFLACSESKRHHTGRTMDEMIGITDFDIFSPDQAQKFHEEEKQVMETGQSLTFEHLLDTPLGIRWYEAIKTPLYDAEGIVAGVLCTERDITDRSNAEKALRESQRTLTTLMSNLPGMAYRCQNDRNWSMEFVSEGCFDLTGYPPSSLIGNRDIAYNQLIHLDDRDKVWSDIQRQLSEKRPFKLTYRIISATGEEKWVWEQGRGIFSPEGDLLHLEGFIHDVTDRIQAEMECDKQRRMLQTVMDSMPDFITFKDRDSNFLMCSKAFLDFLGISEGEAVGRSDLNFFSPEDAWAFRYEEMQVMETGQTLITEHRTEGSWGIRWDEVIKVPLYDEQGRMMGVLSTARDITDRKKAEEDIKTSLREKEILLKEVHHRVKNNLQVISSLLALQTDYVDDPEIRAVFQESRDRVRSMAMVHERLYQSPDLSGIDPEDYINSLVLHLFRAYGASGRGIRQRTDVDKVKLSLDTAIPCGLIINELVSNSLKHAFRNGEEGIISISLRKHGAHKWRLVVSDNGVGLPDSDNWMNSQSLGLQLVVMLVNQLEGTMQLDIQNGTTFQVIFEDRVSGQN
jgi:PAS domain S-box-containing protein